MVFARIIKDFEGASCFSWGIAMVGLMATFDTTLQGRKQQGLSSAGYWCRLVCIWLFLESWSLTQKLCYTRTTLRGIYASTTPEAGHPFRQYDCTNFITSLDHQFPLIPYVFPISRGTGINFLMPYCSIF